MVEEREVIAPQGAEEAMRHGKCAVAINLVLRVDELLAKGGLRQ